MSYMLQKIKHWLFDLMGRERYLRLISRGYFLAYRLGVLRSSPDYELHYFIRHLVNPGDRVIDIGANLGYYSVLFSDLVGPSGQVWSVEPVPLYRRILAANIGRRDNIRIVPYALGADAATVEMGVPGSQPYRHGLTRVLSSGEKEHISATFEVEIRNPVELFRDLEQLDYVKCDVEGYEIHVLPQMLPLFQRFRPVVQVELSSASRAPIFKLFLSENYRAFYVKNQQLHPLKNASQPAFGDTVFYPAESLDQVKEWIGSQQD